MILLALVVQFSLASEAVRDETGLGRASLEVRTRKSSYYVQEPIEVELRFELEQRLQSEQLVALFRPALDLSVQLQAPWLDLLPGAKWRDAALDEDLVDSRTFVLGDAVASAREVPDTRVDGRQFRTYVVVRTLLAQDPGTLELPEARLRYAYATRWSEGFATERVGLDRVDASVRSAARSLSILALPEEGRPGDFCGAVGVLELRGEASAREVELGKSLKLSLHLTGEANFESFDAPRLAPIEGWKSGGLIDQRAEGGRTFEVDLTPLDPRVTRIPPVAFSYFDTTPPASYRTLRTETIPIVVRGAPARVASTPEEPSREGGAFRFIAIAAPAALVVLAALWLFLRRGKSVSRQ